MSVFQGCKYTWFGHGKPLGAVGCSSQLVLWGCSTVLLQDGSGEGIAADSACLVCVKFAVFNTL